MIDISAEDIIIISGYLSGSILKDFQDECDFLRGKYAADDPLERAAALDPFEYSNIPPNSPVRTTAASYFKERGSAINDPNDRSAQRQCSISKAIREDLPTVLAQALHLPTDKMLYLFNEHYVVKDQDSNIAFRWHRDIDEQLSAICTDLSTVPAYYSMWCTLDDVNDANGTINFDGKGRIIAYDCKTCVSSIVNEGEASLIQCKCEVDDESPTQLSISCEVDDESPTQLSISLDLPAGSIVIFSSTKWHSSSINSTCHSRRVYYVQYSIDPITIGKEKEILSYAVPMTVLKT